MSILARRALPPHPLSHLMHAMLVIGAIGAALVVFALVTGDRPYDANRHPFVSPSTTSQPTKGATPDCRAPGDCGYADNGTNGDQ